MKNLLPTIQLKGNQMTVQYLNVVHKFILDWKVFFLIALFIVAAAYVITSSMQISVQEQALQQNKQLINKIDKLITTEPAEATATTPEPAAPIQQPTTPTAAPVKKATKAAAKKDNLANTYSMIGFLVNPGYAERHNVDKAIVEHNNTICYNYIKRYAPVAVEEMKRYNIPASITLAQGLLESNAGTSRLATKCNNHFGIKCFSKSCKKGHCHNFTDDTHKDFFRNYSSSWNSYRGHSVFLNRKRYVHLTKSKDYKVWAYGLKKAGYATDKKYPIKLIRIIKALELYKYDKVQKTTPTPAPIAKAKAKRKAAPVKKKKQSFKKQPKKAAKKAFNPFKKGALPVAEKLTIGRSAARAAAKRLQDKYDIE